MSSSMTTTCGKRYEGGQMVCDRGGFVWDVDDPDPPECLDENESGGPRPPPIEGDNVAPKGDHDEELRKIRENLKS